MKEEKKLHYYGGQGFEGIPENGQFEVKHGDEKIEIKKFTKLSEARKYYDSINDGKGLWDLTNTWPELLECHSWY